MKSEKDIRIHFFRVRVYAHRKFNSVLICDVYSSGINYTGALNKT